MEQEGVEGAGQPAIAETAAEGREKQIPEHKRREHAADDVQNGAGEGQRRKIEQGDGTHQQRERRDVGAEKGDRQDRRADAAEAPRRASVRSEQNAGLRRLQGHRPSDRNDQGERQSIPEHAPIDGHLEAADAFDQIVDFGRIAVFFYKLLQILEIGPLQDFVHVGDVLRHHEFQRRRIADVSPRPSVDAATLQCGVRRNGCIRCAPASAPEISSLCRRVGREALREAVDALQSVEAYAMVHQDRYQRSGEPDRERYPQPQDDLLAENPGNDLAKCGCKPARGTCSGNKCVHRHPPVSAARGQSC